MKKIMVIITALIINFSIIMNANTSEAAVKMVKTMSVKKSVTVYVGDTECVKVNIKPSKKCVKALKIKVNNKGIAKVEYNKVKGMLKITGLREGSTKVILTTKVKNKKGKKISKSFRVNVIDDSEVDDDKKEDFSYYDDYNYTNTNDSNDRRHDTTVAFDANNNQKPSNNKSMNDKASNDIIYKKKSSKKGWR